MDSLVTLVTACTRQHSSTEMTIPPVSGGEWSFKGALSSFRTRTKRQPSRLKGLFTRIRSRSGVLTFYDATDRTANDDIPPRLLWARDMAQPITGRRVVDVGCWTGGLLKLLAPLEPTELMGVDLAGPWLRDAQSAVPSANFVEVTTLSELPATLNHHFDVAMLLETLEHLPEVPKPPRSPHWPRCSYPEVDSSCPRQPPASRHRSIRRGPSRVTGTIDSRRSGRFSRRRE